MTLCFVTDCYPGLSGFGGIASHTQRIAHAMAARGHQVYVVVAVADRIADIDEEGVHICLRPVKWLPLLGKWLPGLGESLSIARVLMQLHRRHRFDIVEIPNWEGIGLISTYAPSLRIVIRLHTSLAESIKTTGGKPDRAERFMIWMEKASTRRARAVVTHSIAHRDLMATSYGRNDIEMIPHGVTIPEKVTPPGGKSVLAIGRMSARKGLDTLLHAIPAVLEKEPDARFLIAGTGEEDPLAVQLRSEIPGLHHIKFLGRVDDDTLCGLYESCAIYVSPAVYESFGLTFAEAMAHGRPVIGCDASAVPEIIRDGLDGFLVPPRDPPALARAIVTLLSDEDLRHRMGANARERAIAHFSIEAAASRIENYFRRVLEKETPSR